MKGLIEPAELAASVAEVVEQRLPLLGDGAFVADDLDLPERGEEVFLRNWIPMMTKRCKAAVSSNPSSSKISKYKRVVGQKLAELPFLY